MKEDLPTEAGFRAFLLGKLDDEQRELIEDLFLTDAQVRERVLAAEQDLIEDYLEDNLTGADRDRFLSRYAQTPAQQRELRITKSIKDWAVREAAVSRGVTSKSSTLSGFRAWLRPAFVVPVTAAIVIAVVVGLWLNGRMQQRNRHLAVEQELARLNSPSSLREDPGQMASLDLSPVTVRSGQSQAEFEQSGDINLLELRLAWIQRERYSTYRAVVRRGDETFHLPELQAEGEGNTIRIRLPTSMLSSGRYEIELTGINPDGTLGLTETYPLIVSS